jgi:Mrp family chromosome partitioning ATPase
MGIIQKSVEMATGPGIVEKAIRRSPVHGNNLVGVRSEQPDEAHLLKNGVIAWRRNDERGEPYRQLRTQLLKEMQKHGWRTLAVTSADDAAGKTLTATNLAIAIGQAVNHTSFLIDLDLRQPSVHETLGLHVEQGISDCLRGDAELRDVLVKLPYGETLVVPGNSKANSASEVLSSLEMARIEQELLASCQLPIIIYDLPSLLKYDDALLFTPRVDATLLVVNDGVTTKEQVQRSFQLLNDVNIIGTILNQAKS